MTELLGRFYTGCTVRGISFWMALAGAVGLWLFCPSARAESTLAQLEERTAAAPGDSAIVYELALAYHADHNLSAAIARYRQALALDPHNPRILTSLRSALQERGMLQDAFPRFTHVLEAPHESPAAAFNLGLVAERSGLIEDAIYHYERYGVLSPGAPDAAAVTERVAALRHAIRHRQVRVVRLTTHPRDAFPGDEVTIRLVYEIRGWGKRNATGVVEEVSLHRSGRQIQRFAQRSIRGNGRTYRTAIQIALPPDITPGAYDLVATVVAGSRRDEQVTPFVIGEHPLEHRTILATQPDKTPVRPPEVQAADDTFTVSDFGPPLASPLVLPPPVEVPEQIAPEKRPAPDQPPPPVQGWLFEENLPPEPRPAQPGDQPAPIAAPDAPPAPAAPPTSAKPSEPGTAPADGETVREPLPGDVQETLELR